MKHANNSHVEYAPSSFPLRLLRPGAGASFKPEHLSSIMESRFNSAFFEIHAENYMGKGGAPHAQLSVLRQDYPISVHGVGLSIGAPGRLDPEHLSRLVKIVERYQPVMVSEHLAWSTHDDIYLNDLLPVPYNKEVLDRVCDHIDEVQTALGRQMLLENPSTYVMFETSNMSETDFIRDISKRTGCGLLLDINNVFISATNHNYVPEDYLAAFPLDRVGEIHLAGHATEQDGMGNPLLIDSHDREVSQAVWDLYRHIVTLCGPIPTLIEWDNNVPRWPVLVSEMELANAIIDDVARQPLLGRRHAG